MFRFERLRNGLPEGEVYDSTFPSKGDYVLTRGNNEELIFGKIESLVCPVPCTVFFDIKADKGEQIRRGRENLQVLLKPKLTKK